METIWLPHTEIAARPRPGAFWAAVTASTMEFGGMRLGNAQG
jgi:hypothetical protein